MRRPIFALFLAATRIPHLNRRSRPPVVTAEPAAATYSTTLGGNLRERLYINVKSQRFLYFRQEGTTGALAMSYLVAHT